MDDRLTHIGNYRIERELARDERRVLYQGWQIALTRPVQITHLTPEAAADAAFVDRWKAVARDLKDPGHPGMPRILEGQFGGEQFYLIESYIVGDTLADQVQVARDLRAGVRLLYGLADVLAYAHRRGWAHGEIALEDVRIGADGNAYLIDLPWHAAQQARGDVAAQRVDVSTLGMFFATSMIPVCGAAPELTADQNANAEILHGWLTPAAVTEPALAEAVAPVLARVLDGDYPDCNTLLEALRPLAQGTRPTTSSQPRAIERTLIEPLSTEQPILRPPTPQPTPAEWSRTPTPRPEWATPQAQGAPAPALAPQATPPARPGGIGKSVAIAAAALVGLIALGVLLCRLEVLPFCVSCDQELIAEYLGAGTGYRTTGAWADAFRELDAGQTECNACSKKPMACSQMVPLWSEAKCHIDSQRLVTEASDLLGDGQACPAVEKLEEAQQLACEPKAAETPLVTGAGDQDGAYVICSISLLEQAGQQTDPVTRESTYGQVYAYLASARTLKPADPTINQLFTRADKYAAARQALDAQDWTAAAAALSELEQVAEDGQYGGQDLDALWFDAHFGEAAAAAGSGMWCEALEAYRNAESVAQTLKQKDDAQKGAQEVDAACGELWTPTPTASPTPVATSTPTATPQPSARVTADQANVRKCPFTGCGVALEVKKGDTLSVNCAVRLPDSTWYQVNLSTGGIGWIRFDMVEPVGTPASCPTIPEPPPPPQVACRPANSQPAVQLIAPARDKDCNGLVRFVWQASGALLANEEYEIHIWPDRQQDKRRIAGTRDTSIVIDLAKVPTINWNDSNRAHFWEVVVVCKTDGRQVSLNPKAWLFYFRTNIPAGGCG